MGDLKAGVEHVEQGLKDTTQKGKQNVKVSEEKSTEKTTDVGAKIQQGIKKITDKV